MNAVTPIPHPATDPAARRQRHDGWTPDRQRGFLEAIADGHSAEAACRLVGMSPSSAYAFRRRAAGAAFALGWRAANLLAREHVADALLARAIDGQLETVTRPNGDVIERHRYDNRLASTMLARLDRQAEADDPGSAAANASARLVAQEFDAFLDLVERDAGPARAGLFVATRDPHLATASVDADIAPVLSLARADRYLRAGAGSAGEVATADLDPARRADWTAEQWMRAEAAGLLRLAPEPKPEPEPEPEESAPGSPLPPLHPDDGDDDDQPVWYDEEDELWCTGFPPPDDFDGEEHGSFGDSDYSRTLTDAEEAMVQRARRAAIAAFRIEAARDRDAWFAACDTGGDREGHDNARPA